MACRGNLRLQLITETRGAAINLSMSLNSFLTFVSGVATVAMMPSEWRNVYHYEDDVRNR